MDGIGSSTLPVTTSSERARQMVRQGVALLHCFWDFEALRAFKAAARLDPSCAMAQWGVAQTIEHPYRAFLSAWPHADPDLPEVMEASAWLGNATDQPRASAP